MRRSSVRFARTSCTIPIAAFAPEAEHRVYGRGIRRRLAPMLGNDQQRIRLALALTMALPGTPVLLYGDEIGMGEDLSLPGRLAVRNPMQWSPGPAGGTAWPTRNRDSCRSNNLEFACPF